MLTLEDYRRFVEDHRKLLKEIDATIARHENQSQSWHDLQKVRRAVTRDMQRLESEMQRFQRRLANRKRW